jgi:serine/threonine protein kinase
MIDPETIIDGRYRVISRIGSGGMADVYLAEDQLLGRKVAVKLLHHRFAEDQEFVERFRREAQSAAGLSHPNVVAVFDRGEWDGSYYIAMEYLPGRSLKRIVREDGALDPLQAIDIVIQILNAARFAHRRGIIHRDLKPHNVILDEEGRAKVTDFGIARAGASDMTLTGSIMGTAQYLSPEQAQGHPVSASSDLYAIGIVLYELLTGQIPFDGETAVSIALKQVSAVPPPPSALNPAVTPALDAVVRHALAKDQGERFTDAEEFIAALQQVRGELASGHVTTVAPAVGPNGRSSSGGLLLAPEPLQEERKRSILPWVLAGVLCAAAIAAAVLLLVGRTQHVTVPRLAGLSRGTAQARLRAQGLQASFSSATNPTISPGLVVSSSPPAGSTVAKESRIAVVVSSGPGSAAVPEVLGLSSAAAERALRARDFRPVLKSLASSTVKEGSVISTDPSAQTSARLGSTVSVVVSSGLAKVGVPDLTGDTKAQAQSALATAGLKLGSTTKQTSTQTAGTVLSQSPEGGTSATAGTSVDLVLAKTQATVRVPNVVGKKEERAAGELVGAGFEPETVTVPVTEAALAGTVVSQSPAAGKKAKHGATVTINVGQLASSTTATTETTSTSTTSSSGAATPTPPVAGQ